MKNIKKMKSFTTFKKEALRDPAVRAAYDELEPTFALIKKIIEKRINEGLTQAALAKKVGTKQSAIARFESGMGNPTVGFLHRIAKALDARVKISISK